MKSIITVPMNKKMMLLMMSGLLLVGCSRYINAPTFQNVTPAEKNGEMMGIEKDVLVGEMSDTIFEEIDRSFKMEEPLETGVIEKSGMEVKVPEGRYTIYGGRAGSVSIYDEQGKSLMKETFDQYYGVMSLTVDLSERHTIFFNGGFEGATITYPEERVPNELTTGIWSVGEDIDAGEYLFSTSGLIGYVQVFERGKEVRVYELLGREPANSKSNIRLENGQKIKLTGASSFYYESSE